MYIIVLIVGLLIDYPTQLNGWQSDASPRFRKAIIPNELALIDPAYASIKLEIANLKLRYRTLPISSDSLSKLFTSLLVDKLIPHWLTTPWSFEGHTSIPGEGTIACGYFISTTLSHMSFNLNRYKMAQQLPLNEAKTLNLGKPLLEINNPSTADRIEILRGTLQEGIYFIGFDQSHVSYIQKKGDQVFVIHSNYINAEGVVIEKIEESQVFSYYTRLYIAEISTNRELMKKWLNHEVVNIVSE